MSDEFTKSLLLFSTLAQGLTKYGKMAMALSVGYHAKDFELPSFMFEKMTGSADDFYRHSMTKVAVNAVEGRFPNSSSISYFLSKYSFEFQVFKGNFISESFLVTKNSKTLKRPKNEISCATILCPDPHVSNEYFDRALVLSKPVRNQYADHWPNKNAFFWP